MSKELSEMTIAELVEHEALTRAFIERGVIEARRGQTPWHAIAASLGVTMQEAHRRYAHIARWVLTAEGIPDRPSNAE